MQYKTVFVFDFSTFSPPYTDALNLSGCSFFYTLYNFYSKYNLCCILCNWQKYTWTLKAKAECVYVGVTGGVVCVVGGGGGLVTKWQIVMERREEAVSPGTVV